MSELEHSERPWGYYDVLDDSAADTRSSGW